MKPRCRSRHEPIDLHLIVSLGGEARVDQLDETKKEFRYGRDVGLAEDKMRLLLYRRRDPRRGCGDGMVDERAKLATLQLGLTSRANATGHDREVEGRHHGHGSVVVGLEELLRQDRPMRRQVEPRRELSKPARIRRGWRPCA